MAGWRYLLQRYSGTAWGEFLHTDLPLTNVSIMDNLTATNELTAEVSAGVAGMKAADGRPLFEEWGTAIWAEDSSGDIRGGGILETAPHTGQTKSLRCIGLSGIPFKQPYGDGTGTDSTFFVETDPLAIHEHVYNWLQAKPGGDVGLEIGACSSPVKIGYKLDQVEFDTESGLIGLEAGPFKLNWYETHDLGPVVQDLAETTPFDYREVHWWDGDTLRHKLERGYPTLGARLDHLRFVVGENILVQPSVEPPTNGPVTDVMVLGAGNGRTMIRGYATQPTGRIRRVLLEERKDLKLIAQADRRAAVLLKQALVAGRQVSGITLRDSSYAPITSIRPGDEVPLQLDDEWSDEFMWCRVTNIQLAPDQSDDASLTLVRTDQVA
jgi:hypothetical protein